MLLAHFTDVHFTEAPLRVPWRSLLSKRFLGWLNLLLRRRGEFRDAPEVVRAFLEDLERVQPDHILSTGDLTGLALESEFEAARAALEPLLDDPRVTGIPGNHDVYVRSAVRARLYQGAFGAWTRTDVSAEDFPSMISGLYPYPLVRLLGDEAALLCLKDVFPTPLHDSTGAVGAVQIMALGRLLAEEPVAPRTKLLALHCSPCREGGRPDRRLHGLRDWPSLLDVVQRGGVRLVLAGHVHRRFVVPRWGGSEAAVANPGSLTSAHGERAYHLIAVEDGRVRLEARRYDAAARAFAAWPKASGAGWLG